MREQTSYLSKKFIRNGISSLIVAALLIITKKETDVLGFAVYMFPLIGILWFALGLAMRKKLKAHPKTETEKVEMFNSFKTFRMVESMFTVVLILCVAFSIRHIMYIDYFMLLVIAIYAAWLYKQIKLINDYFKNLQN